MKNLINSYIISSYIYVKRVGKWQHATRHENKLIKDEKLELRS